MTREQLNKQVGLRVYYYRKKLNWTLSDLAQKLDVSIGYLSNVENGKNFACFPNLLKIIICFNITWSEFFEEFEHLTIEQKKEIMLIKSMQGGVKRHPENKN